MGNADIAGAEHDTVGHAEQRRAALEDSRRVGAARKRRIAAGRDALAQDDIAQLVGVVRRADDAKRWRLIDDRAAKQIDPVISAGGPRHGAIRQRGANGETRLHLRAVDRIANPRGDFKVRRQTESGRRRGVGGLEANLDTSRLADTVADLRIFILEGHRVHAIADRERLAFDHLAAVRRDQRRLLDQPIVGVDTMVQRQPE